MKRVIFLCSLIGWISCQQNTEYQRLAENPEFLHSALSKLTDIIVYDIFSPPVASRNYAYPSIAAYEAIQQAHPENASFAGRLHELTETPAPPQEEEVHFGIAAFHAFAVVGKALIFSENRMDEFMQTTQQEYRDMGVPRKVLRSSLSYG
ncbi:MAG: phosphatidic acid phosphatase, partial [Saprospiraceae bacterium]|nr:phosphatidic acid phosphatase [Saprospiraceae bacterium]